MTIRRMQILCWLPKATNQHTEYVIPIAFPLQHWLHERISMLRHTYVVCVAIFIFLDRKMEDKIFRT
jgi:hypothetical protein